MTSLRRIIVLVAGLVISTAAPLCARQGAPPAGAPPPPIRQQVVSANPFGVLVDFFNVEFERKVSWQRPCCFEWSGAQSRAPLGCLIPFIRQSPLPKLRKIND